MAALPVCLFSSFFAMAQTPTDEPASSQEEIPEHSQATQRELMAEEDPLATKEADKERRDALWEEIPNTVRTYGSVRVR